MRVERGAEDHPESLVERAIRGELAREEQVSLDRHLAACGDCAAEIEAARVLAAATATGPEDEALNRAAVEAALARLQEPEHLGEKLRRFLATARRHPGLGLALAGAAAALIIGISVARHRPTAPPTVASAPDPRTLHLGDGSEITPVAESTTVEVAEQTPVRTTVRLRTGSAQFRIRHDVRRVFRVDAGPIAIEDLGTVFRVDHEPGDRVRVSVSEGRVAVVQATGLARIELGPGEERVFAGQAEPSEVAAPAAAATAPAPSPASSPAGGSPRAPARSRATDEAGDLLLAADTARRSRHPEAAVLPLRRLVDHHPKDPRAPAAAFTLGWVLLTDLGRAREAAAAFAEAERIAPRGALAEDAAARVAEAWQKAGDSRRAAAAARHYAALYPAGRYMTLMRGLIGEH